MMSVQRLLWRAAAGSALASAFLLSAHGQQQQTNTSGRNSDAENARREADRRMRERELQERQFALRAVESEAGRRPEDPRAPKLDVTQIVQDFKLLQVVSRDLVQATSGAAPLDLELVTKSAADIRRRAERLSANLVLPKPEKGAKRPKHADAADADALKRTLADLDKLIDEFAHNPVFREINLVDAKLSAKARRDLDDIIELSGHLRKSSERLGKQQRTAQ